VIESTASVAQPAPALQRPARVLVVDDNSDFIESVSVFLRLEGYEVASAGSAYEMWRVLDGYEPDVVLLDIGLPDESGYDVARALIARYRGHAPVLIALTAWNTVTDRMLAEFAGFDHHVAKPYDARALADLIARSTYRVAT